MTAASGSSRLAPAVVGVAGAAVLAAAVTAALTFSTEDEGPLGCSGRPGTSTPAQPSSSEPSGQPLRREAVAFGATGDGVSDDGPALQRALDALQPGEVLELAPGGVYRHSDVLRVRRPGVRVTGAAVLSAMDEERSAVVVEADDVVLDGGLVLRVEQTSRRWDEPHQHKLTIAGAQRVHVRDVAVQGAAAAGVFVSGSSDFVLERVSVHDARADGVHLTGGSQRGAVLEPVVRRSGDDGVAVVSYDDDDAVTSDITVRRPVVEQMRGGRGLSVSGGRAVVYCDIRVVDSWGAAVYIASEGDPWHTGPVSRVTVEGGTVERANRDEETDHGAVLVYSGRDATTVTDVLVRDVRIVDTRDGASRQVGLVQERGRIGGVALQDLEIRGGGQPFESTAGGEAYSLSGMVVDGTRHADHPAAP